MAGNKNINTRENGPQARPFPEKQGTNGKTRLYTRPVSRGDVLVPSLFRLHRDCRVF